MDGIKEDCGIKHDGAKEPLDLLSTRWLLGVGRVLAHGAKKYGRDNWRKGIHYSRLVAATLRHLLAWNGGEDLDPETGLSHLHHASCSLMFLAELYETHAELDDRYRVKKPGPEKPPESVIDWAGHERWLRDRELLENPLGKK